ncbi:MAG: MBL fold metallo-hydrolase, partial [Nitrospirota bacterium]|nr:MBL fold metallo-hydrolase [Nitrospirota bacterium]
MNCLIPSTKSPEFILTHLGGYEGVTGSCHLLQVKGLNILVDCGSVQGDDTAVTPEDWPVSVSDINYLFLTHAHIDHIGRVPELVRGGFKGEIITTHGTKALLLPMLEDALSFSAYSEKEAAVYLDTIDDLAWGFEYNETFDLRRGLRFTLGRAGHILGSCFIRFEWENPAGSLIFSGDLGARNTPLLPDPDIPAPCDFLVLESTYGDRCHEDRRERTRRLAEALSRALNDGGKVFIPAFAVGRVEEVVYEMDRIFSDPHWQGAFPDLSVKRRIPVFLDSPLGIRITEIYSRLSEYWDREAKSLLRRGDHPIDFANLYAVKNYEDHRKVLEMPGPSVIIAGSGMCTGGRIVEHLKSGLEDPCNDLFFVGYQARGTPGRAIMEYSRRSEGYLMLEGRRYRIRAKVDALSGYSAHADQKELLEWVSSLSAKPSMIRLVHGEPGSRHSLQELLRQQGYRVATV